MRPSELLVEMSRRGAVVSRGSSGVPRLHGVGQPPPELMAAAREYRWLFIWGLHGAESNHVWLVCDACGEVQLLRQARAGCACAMTPRCGGHMRTAPQPKWEPSTGAARRSGPVRSPDLCDV
jgi:hypothetical protein